MSSTPSLPEPANDATQRDEDAQYYCDILHELVEMATDIARAVHRQATTQPAAAPGPETHSQSATQPAPAPDPTIAFDRITRTIRRTIALARKLAEPAPLNPAQGTRECRLAARKRIIREVEDTIQRRTEGPEADALHAELSERLDAPDLDDDIDGQPIADIIAAICRDLGIAHHPGTHPWKRRTPRDVRDLCARAAGPSVAHSRTAQPRIAQSGTSHPRPLSIPPPRPPTSTGPPGP